MNREDYWHDEYDKASKEFEESRAKLLAADSSHAAALATFNRARRELNRLYDLRFNKETKA